MGWNPAVAVTLPANCSTTLLQFHLRQFQPDTQVRREWRQIYVDERTDDDVMGSLVA